MSVFLAMLIVSPSVTRAACAGSFGVAWLELTSFEQCVRVFVGAAVAAVRHRGRYWWRAAATGTVIGPMRGAARAGQVAGRLNSVMR
ncbi:hypothetical protein ACQP1G_24010 [Nocardia sp. CA-107356]|uniref:hypothetical protein n=1 Tax=Nocardia sp. CA-107356 TaxID=3239972 RepID=UPI003D8DDF16